MAASFLRSLLCSEIVFFFFSPSRLLKLTAFGTAATRSQIKIFYEIAQTNTLRCGAPVTSRALFCLFRLVRQAFIPLPARHSRHTTAGMRALLAN